LLIPSLAEALEKYGRPLPALNEPVEPDVEKRSDILVQGYVLSAAFVSNPPFAARPDNSGHVGLRHMVHLEADLYKEYLTFYTDQNFLSGDEQKA
jgi:hypothetical protein